MRFGFSKRAFTFALIAAMGVVAQAQTQFYVSPQGNDSWAGTLAAPNANKTNGPKRTPAGAQTAMRTYLTKNSYPAAGFVINIAAGTYDMNTTLSLDARDSGTANGPVVWRGAGKTTTLFNGGIQLSVWKKASTADTRLNRTAVSKIMVANLSTSRVPAATTWTRKGFPNVTNGYQLELYYDGNRQTLAQYPNSGWLTPSVDDSTGLSIMNSGLTGKAWRMGDVRAYGFFGNNWAESYENVSSVAGGKATLSTASAYGVNRAGRVKFVNVLEELDAPGEYYIDYAAQQLYYYPIDSTMSKRVSVANNRGGLVMVYNANNIKFENIGFAEGAYRGMTVLNGSNITVTGCAFKGFNREGLMATGTTNFNIAGSDFTQNGEGGIYLSTGNRTTLTSGGSSITNCFFSQNGQVCKTNKPSIDVYGVGTLVANNRFTNLPHQAIWVHGNDHVIEKNEISQACMDTDDAGAIYMGRNMSEYGNVIRYNVIQDCIRRTGGKLTDRVVGIYLDDLASGTQIYGNVIRRTDLGIMLGGGRDNKVTDNAFEASTDSIHIDARGQSWYANFISSGSYRTQFSDINPAAGAWFTKYPQVYNLPSDNPASPKRNLIDRNVTIGTSFIKSFDNMVLGTSDSSNFKGLANYTGFQTTFVDLSKNDLRPLPGSPAASIGFVAGPTNTAGLKNADGRSGVVPL